MELLLDKCRLIARVAVLAFLASACLDEDSVPDLTDGVALEARGGIKGAPTDSTSAPTIIITTPTREPSYTSADDVITLAGKVRSQVAVDRVTWSNSAGGEGMASGTGNWVASGISLSPGLNVFTVTVHAVGGGTGTATLGILYEEPAPEPNRAPVISGAVPPVAAVDQPYRFQPDAHDPDGDVLTYRIANQPSWANFDSQTGELSGLPDAASVGTTHDVMISVTDGVAEASLAPADITVTDNPASSATLSWVAPTENADGSPLTDLAGYRIRYGNAPGDYAQEVVVDNPGVTSQVIDNLVPGTWYFVITAYDYAGQSSEYSNVASTQIQ